MLSETPHQTIVRQNYKTRTELLWQKIKAAEAPIYSVRKGRNTTTNRPVLLVLETPTCVYDPTARKALKILGNIEKQSEKIAEKSFKKALQ